MKYLLSALALALAGCGGGGGSSSGGNAIAIPIATPTPSPAAPTAEAPPVAEAPKGCRVIIYGDSIIADPLLTETIPASIKRQRPAWTVENRAHGGQTAQAGGRTVVNDYILPGDRVVMQWGVNDSKLGTRLDNMGEAAKFVKSQGGTVIITGLVKISDPHNAAYDAEARRIALEVGAAFVSWNELEITTFDGTHPDQPSTDRLVEDLLNTLDKECP